MIRKLLPSPTLSLVLFVAWLLLNQSLDLGTVLLGVLLALLVPGATKGLRPAHVRMRNPRVALRLLGHAIYDMGASALTVARSLLTRRTANIDTRFVHVPLQLRDPNGLAVLSMIMCLTPGTAWGELAFDRSTLLVHLFEVEDGDEAAFIELVKTRYEKPLMEIFE